MKLVLAIDLFETDVREPDIFQALDEWCEHPSLDVMPVYIHSSSIETDMILDHAQKPLSIPPELKGFAELKVINIPVHNRKKEIESLLKYAKDQHADMIALVSQGKSGLEKKILGSFAEALLVQSDIPILFLEENVRSRPKENRALYITDFSEASKNAFDIFLKHLKIQRSEIVIFNAIPLPKFAATAQVYSQALTVIPQQYWDEQREWAERQALELVKRAQAHGFSARFEIANQVYSVENEIHEVVRREKVNLLGLVSVSSPMERFFLGSLSRSILRTRLKPMWISGPQACLHSIREGS